MQHFFATQTVPRTYVWHNRLTTDFVAITFFAIFCYEDVVSQRLTEVSKGQKEGGRRIPATDVQQVPHFFFFQRVKITVSFHSC